MEIEIHTYLGSFKVWVDPSMLPWEDVFDAQIENRLKSLEEDLPDDMYLVPDYWEDPDRHRRMMERIQENSHPRGKPVKMRMLRTNFRGITWGGQA